MHADSGQFAIQNAELSEEFKRIARYEDQEGRVYDKHGNLLLIDDDVTEKNRPEVDRGQLRQMMLDSVPEGTVHWDHELSAIQHQDDGTFDLAFRSGATERFSLIVGADGAWSRVRPLVSAMVAETRPRRMQNKLLLFLRECRAGLLQCIKAQQININSVPTRLLIDRS
jgi:2-polyprenyl-6-methoxyphenol hydroxylase-like FAD-dependent oxidoreductase